MQVYDFLSCMRAICAQREKQKALRPNGAYYTTFMPAKQSVATTARVWYFDYSRNPARETFHSITYPCTFHTVYYIDYEIIECFIFCTIFLLPAHCFAESNTGFVQGIWYSQSPVFDGVPTRIYVAVRNNTTRLYRHCPLL